MTNAEREGLKDNLREMIAGRDDGIELKTEFRWVVSGIKQPAAFFQSLPLLLASDAILYFEGCAVSRDVAAFYVTNQASHTVAVMRATIFPVSECFHVCFSPEVLAKLGEWATSRPIMELFDHVKAYQGTELLVHFHDAFEKDFLLISDRVPQPAVAEFSSRLSASFHREPTVNKRMDGLRGLLKVLENPAKVRIRGEPWWKRWWRRWTWR